MKKKPLFSVIIYALVLAVVAVATIYSFWDKNTVSETEKRSLQSRPALNTETWFTATFAAQMEEFLSDHIFQRSQLIQTAQSLEYRMKRPLEVATVMVNDGGNPNSTSSHLLLEDRVLLVFKDNDEPINMLINTANQILSHFPNDMNKYFMMAPTRVAFETEEVAQYSQEQKNTIERAYRRLRSSVMTVDVYTPLEAEAAVVDLDLLYYRLDHHWSQYGAYIAIKTMCDTYGLPYTPIEEYTRYEHPRSFWGFLYASNQRPEYYEIPDTLYYYLLNEDQGSEVVYRRDSENPDELIRIEGYTIDPLRYGYDTFVEANYSHAILQGVEGRESCIMVMGDSFMSAAAPWLAASYGKVVVVDPRYYQGGMDGLMELAEENGVTDVLILSTFFAISMDSLLK